MSRVIAVLMTTVLIACGDGGVEPKLDPHNLALAVTEGAGQRDTVARLLSVPVTVRTSDVESRDNVPGVLINWFRVAGTDTVFSGVGVTNASGEARFQWTLLPRAGDQKVIAWALDDIGEQIVHGEAAAEALPARPARIVPLSPFPQLWLGGTVGGAQLASAVDRFNNTTPTAVSVIPGTGWQSVTGGVQSTALGSGALTFLADTARLTITTTVLRDLRELRGWQALYSCGDSTMSLPFREYDYRQSSGVVDSVHSVPMTNGHEWRLWITTTHIQHSDRTLQWDTLSVREMWLVQSQSSTGALRIPYLNVLTPTGALIRRADLTAGDMLPWDQDRTQYSGGNACLSGWQAAEPHVPLTLHP